MLTDEDKIAIYNAAIKHGVVKYRAAQMAVKIKPSKAWWNYDTKSYDYLTEPPFGSPQEALPYINDWPGARSLFLLLIDWKGYSVPQAMLEVLEKLVPPLPQPEPSAELTDADLDHVTGGARPSPERDCWAAPMGGKCYPAAPLRGVRWPPSLRTQRAARYGDK